VVLSATTGVGGGDSTEGVEGAVMDGEGSGGMETFGRGDGSAEEGMRLEC